MLSISDGFVTLRDFIEDDIAVRVAWETVYTEWQLWDAPWEYEGLSDAEKEEALDGYIAKMKGWVGMFRDMPDTQPRTGFQICTNGGEYVGFCNSYRIDDEYTYSPSGSKCAIGIDIPDAAHRGKGYARHALRLFIDYLSTHGQSDIYLQTWSGNVRMASLAAKLGFEECCRKPGIRLVRGEKYDGLTFRLNKTLCAAAKASQ